MSVRWRHLILDSECVPERERERERAREREREREREMVVSINTLVQSSNPSEPQHQVILYFICTSTPSKTGH